MVRTVPFTLMESGVALRFQKESVRGEGAADSQVQVGLSVLLCQSGIEVQIVPDMLGTRGRMCILWLLGF